MKTILDNEAFPLDELALIFIIGFVALLAALVLFQKREFTHI